MKNLAWGMVVIGLFMGCTGNGNSTSASGGNGGEGASGGMGASSGSGVGGDAASTSSSASSSSGGGGLGRCLPGCTMASDCCAPGQTDCPNGTYPNNPTCEGGYCRPPQCTATSDCTSLGANFDCLSNDGIRGCGITCTTDSDCLGTTTCTGVDADGKKFCKGSGQSQECMADADCNGRGKCIGNECRCASTAECTHATYDTCIQ